MNIGRPAQVKEQYERFTRGGSPVSYKPVKVVEQQVSVPSFLWLVGSFRSYLTDNSYCNM